MANKALITGALPPVQLVRRRGKPPAADSIAAFPWSPTGQWNAR